MNAKLIGIRLKKLRGKKTRSEVAHACNITETALGNYENGLRIPRDEVKEAIADYYGVTVQHIFFAK